MPTATAPVKNAPPALQVHSPMAAFLSYLVPGLGQIYQGRVAKGVLFMVCVYGLFFYGMALGRWQNVWLNHSDKQNIPKALEWSPPLQGLGELLGDLYNRPQFLGQFWVGIAAWPAVGQYNAKDGLAFFGKFERTPPEEVLNDLQTHGDKTWDLAWVYTVIAGVLNVLIIYDALAGPAFSVDDESQRPSPEPSTP